MRFNVSKKLNFYIAILVLTVATYYLLSYNPKTIKRQTLPTREEWMYQQKEKPVKYEQTVKKKTQADNEKRQEISKPVIKIAPAIHIKNIKRDEIKNFQCLRNVNNLETFPKIQPASNKPIFFLETTCSPISDKVILTIRQGCSIESAARLNPDMEIYVLFAAPVYFNPGKDVQMDILEALSMYDNIRFNHVDIDSYFIDTPLQELYESGTLEYSKYAKTHLNKILILLTLWKFGGISLELGDMVISSLNDLSPNFSSILAKGIVGLAAAGFSTDAIGHGWVDEILNDINSNYDPDAFNTINEALMRFLKNTCDTEKISKMTPKKCQSYKLYPNNTFYPVDALSSWVFWVDHALVANSIKKTKVIHFWKSMAKGFVTTVGNASPYEVLASQFCPQIYDTLKPGSVF